MGEDLLSNSNGKLPWWQLTLFGVGCTIGTGFFLGSSIAIKKSGLSVLFIYILAAVATLFVYEALAQMTMKSPQKGSFRTYAKDAYGRWAGFGMGWIYWCSEILILGSTLTALGLFSRLWFPNVPLWIFTAVYAVLGLLIVILGSKGINKAENLFALVKIAAMFMFIVISIYALTKGIGKWEVVQHSSAWFDKGPLGMWKGLLYALYAFGGIEVMGFMAAELRNPEEAPKAGRYMLLGVTVLYVLVTGLSLLFVDYKQVTPHESTIIAALKVMNLPVLVHILNGVMIIGGFSILVASLYAVSTMLVALAEDNDAPAWLAHTQGKRQLPLRALAINTLGLGMSIVLALLLPKQVFEHITTAAGLVILYAWLFILASYLKLMRPTIGGWIKSCIALLLITAAIGGALLEPASRPGFWCSILIVVAIGIITCFMQYKWKRKEPHL
jgi:aromatic amino acid permease